MPAVSDLLLCVLIAVNAGLVFLYFTRRKFGVYTWFDEPLIWSLGAAVTAMWISTIINGQFAMIIQGVFDVYGDMGTGYQMIEYIMGAYFLFEVGQFLYSQIFNRIEYFITHGHLPSGDTDETDGNQTQ